MLAALSLLTLLAGPTAETAPPAVAVLPFVAGPGTTKKQAAGVTALFRKKVESVDFLKLLKQRRDDKRTVRKCKRDAACYGQATFSRGASLLAYGEVTEQADGFGVYILVFEPKAKEPLRQVIGDIVGAEEDIDDRLARMIRETFAPEALAGGIVIHGNPEGAAVYLDDKLAGELPLPPTTGVVEGEYVLRIEKDGYYPHVRPVNIRFSEITVVDVTLVSKRKKFEQSKVFEDESEGTGPNLIGPIATAAVGGALAVVAAGLGTVSLLDSLEVERRAATQNLLFPRDGDLIARGRLFATLSTLTWATSALAVAGGGAWAGAAFALAPKPDEKKTAAPRIEAPAAGAPATEDLEPTVLR